MADKEDDAEYDHYDGGGKDSPGNFGTGVADEIVAARANVFGAGELQFGEFHDRRRRFGRGRRGLRLARFGYAWFFWRGWARRRGRLRLPDFVGVDLGLAQAAEVVGDGLFVVESEMLGVGADETFVEDAAGELVEALLFNGQEHARADFGDVGDVFEREFFLLARFAEFVAEVAHVSLPRT